MQSEASDLITSGTPFAVAPMDMYYLWRKLRIPLLFISLNVYCPAEAVPNEILDHSVPICESHLLGRSTYERASVPFQLDQMLNKLYRRKTWGFRLAYEPYLHFEKFMCLKVFLGDQSGAVCAEPFFDEPSYALADSHLPPELRGKGMGKFMYLALAKFIMRDHGQTLCAHLALSPDSKKLWRSMNDSGWVEVIEVGRHGLRQCIKRKLVEDGLSELVDFVDKRRMAPRPPSFLEMIRGRPRDAF